MTNKEYNFNKKESFNINEVQAKLVATATKKEQENILLKRKKI